MVLAAREVQYGGVILGPPPYRLQSIEGLGSPEVRTSDRPLLRRHGLYPGSDFLGGRSVVITFVIDEDDPAAFAAAVATARAAFTPGGDEAPLSFNLPGVAGTFTARVTCRPRRLSMPVDVTYWTGGVEVVVELAATSPRIEADDLSTLSTTLPTAGGGLVFPVVFPVTFGAVSTGGSIIAVNEGNFPAPAVFRIDGPATNPRIEHVGLSQTIGVTLTVGVGEWLVIDTEARTVLLNGTASRYSSLTAGTQWFDLEPGSNELRFSASTTTAATLQATWRSAWV